MTKKTLKAMLIAAVTSTILVTAAGPAAAGTVLPDPEKYVSTPTAWGWFLSASKATIDNWANTNNMRVVDVEVDSPTTFNVTLVQNSGVYARGLTGSASWTTGETAATLSAKLMGKRLLDVERYLDNGQVRYAAALVDNPAGGNFHDYKYLFNGTSAQINGWLAANRGRLTDIDYVSPDHYDAVLVPNTGVDERSWVWYPDATTQTVNDEIDLHLDSRMVAISPIATSHFAMIFVRNDPQVGVWNWHPSLSASQLISVQSGDNYRVLQAERYWSAGSNEWRYAAVFIEND
ncbi:hypothetical protein Cs7R123_62660 [Catellatospora sp. TT07R-123]|uniref:hypothetical protein n=1 Tax=Catellatospora sp. TT07R-123 TaxID=2733863 RepID=UPI001B168F79|nr:hypothetical protein [Catellatospora sp. TT07R-123]GHJ48924.1 hypothetical protein Cs7R123_62660 [Catellatospora sp. TT07R-123]